MKYNKPRVGIVGGFQMGKSTLINCLLDAKVARTGGLGIAVTSVITRYTYGNMQSVNYFSEGRVVHTCRLHEFLEDTTVIPNADIPTVDEVVITLWKPLLKYIDLIDTPGFKANDRDTFTTLEAMKGIDIVVVLLNNKSLDSKEVEIFNAMNRSGKPFLVLINCVNQGGVLWDPAAEQNKHIFSEIEGRIRNIGCSPIHIPGRMSWGCNLMWYWYASDQYLQDNKQQVELTESQTAHFAKTFLKLSPDDRPAMAERSNFLSIRALFENGDDWGFPVNFLRWSSGINDSFTDWEDSIKKLVNEL